MANNIFGEVKLGKNVIIEETAIIYGPVTIGDNSYIGHRAIIGYPKLQTKKKILSEGKLKEGGIT